jgi:Flp pilus assembly protein TadG
MLRNFKECQSGNLAILFALAVVPAVSLVGLAVDYARAENVRNRLTVAIDATALALAHSSVNLTTEEVQKKADDLFAGNFGHDAGVTAGQVKAVRSPAELTVQGSAQIKTTFLKIMNINTLDVQGSSKVVWGATNVEVVLALDNTKSMAGNKLVELKNAATELIDTLEETADVPGSVKIGLVPFATTVRIDPGANADAEWIYFPDREIEDDDDDRGRGDDDDDDRHGGRGDDDDDDRRGRNGDDDGRGHGQGNNDGPRTVPFDKANWRGCIQDRDQDYDTGDGSYDTDSVNTLYPAVEECPSDERNLAAVQPLTTDFDTLRNAVKGMKAAGSTNVTIGIAWGLSLLSSKAPYTQGASETGTGKTQKYLIVLTDGENTRNRFSGNTSEIDARTKLACQSARAAGTIFTIRVIDGDESLLRACASDTSNFYDVENAAEMTPIFRAIANEIAKLRIAS